MKQENAKKIITFLRSAEYIYTDTYFNDYSYSPRPTHNFLIMQEGEAHIVKESGNLHISKNDVLWIPKGSKYSVVWQGTPVQFSVLHFDFSSQFDPFFGVMTNMQILSAQNIEELLNDFHFLKNQKPKSDVYMTLSVFYRIFARLHPSIRQQKASREQLVIQPALDYIEAHYQEKLKVDTLSNLCFISPSRFQHLFKKLMGVSPITYKNTVLIRHAQQTIISEKNLSIQAIADMYGFDSMVYFCRLFKKVTGTTPMENRQLNTLI